MKKKWGLLITGILVITGCSSMDKKQDVGNQPARLVALENLMDTPPKRRRGRQKDEVSPIREDMLRDTALSLGARSAYAYRTGQINTVLHGRQQDLSAIFDFDALLLENNVQPPVLVENSNSLTVGSPLDLRVSDKNYQILRQARFVTTPPVWSDYLLMPVDEPEAPDKSLLPKNDEESKVWRKNIREGWSRGIVQADQVYEANLNRLKRDYQGMIRYRVLLAQNMVSAPEVAQRDLGVTGGGDELSINDRVFTITALPALRADSRQWEATITD